MSKFAGRGHAVAFLGVISRKADRFRGAARCQFAANRPGIERAQRVNDRPDPRAGQRFWAAEEIIDHLLQFALAYGVDEFLSDRLGHSPQ